MARIRTSQGTVVCSAMGGNMNIAIGDAATGIAAVVSEDGSPPSSPWASATSTA